MVTLIADPQLATWRLWDHMGALRLLFFLYRKPHQFKEQLTHLKRREQIGIGLGMYLHGLPLSLLLSIVGVYVINKLGGDLLIEYSVFLAFSTLISTAVSVASIIIFGFGLGILFGIACCIAVGLFYSTVHGCISDNNTTINFAIVFGTILGIILGVFRSIVYKSIFVAAQNSCQNIVSTVHSRILGSVLLGISFGISIGIYLYFTFGAYLGIAAAIIVSIIIGIVAPRAYYLPYHFLLSRFPTRIRSLCYRYHPVTWDESFGPSFKGLSDILVAVWQDDPVIGRKEINFIVARPTQRQEGLIALTVIQLRASAQVKRLAGLYLDLPEGPKGFLAQTPRVRELAHEIAHQALLLESANRPYIRQMYYELLMEKLTIFELSTKGMSHPLPKECAAAAQGWRILAEALRPNLRNLTATVPAVFRAGEQLDVESDAFIHRLGLFGSLERQLSQPQGCPGLVLYGRRRVGKTTLLHNLPFFLPDTTLTLPFSMQDASFFTDLAGFVNSLNQQAHRIPLLATAQAPTQDLAGLLKLLGQWNQALGTKYRMLIIVDEYEKIDQKIQETVFPVELLETLRVSIQQHRQITWLFAGNHRIDELLAPWTSHLIACETLDVPFFALEETQLLLTDPLARSPHWGTRDNRPRLANFWADGHIERLHHETGGWPYLVQLVAQKLVDQANDLAMSQTTDALMEQALDDSAKSAHNFLRELIVVETSEAQSLYLEGFLTHPEQPPHLDPDTQRALLRSQLIVQSGPNFRLRAPLMARWMAVHM